MTAMSPQPVSIRLCRHTVTHEGPDTMTHDKPLVAFLIGCLMFLPACSNEKGRYSCGVPDGPTCLSALQVYDATDLVAPTAPNPQAAPRRGAPPESHDAMHADGMRVTADVTGQLQLTVEMATPGIESIPEREPARIMRIWMAPWQDARGDLVDASRRYAEIVPARWRVPPPKPSADPGIKLIRLHDGAPMLKAPTTSTGTETLSR